MLVLTAPTDLSRITHPGIRQLVSSAVLHPVFRNKSSNSQSFAFAILLAEGLVRPGDTEDSGYVIGDIDAFKQAMSALVASDTDLSTPVDIPVSASTKPKRNAKGAA